MKKLIVNLALVAVMVSAAFLPSVSAAEKADLLEPQEKGDPSEFPFGLSVDELAEDFLHIAINPIPPERPDADDLQSIPAFVKSVKNARYFLEEKRKKIPYVKSSGYIPPWYDEYFLRTQGVPPRGKISKWQKPVVIGLGDYRTELVLEIHREGGYPSEPLPLEEMKALLFKRNSFGLSPYLTIDEQVKGLLPDLKKATGLDISYKPGVFGEQINVLIVLDDLGLGDGQYFKWKRRTDHEYHTYYNFIQGKVMFTPARTAQVDGFLILASDGSIDRVVCNIYPYLPTDLIRSLTSECLVRAMGLPVESEYVKNTVVGPWNVSHENAPAPVLPEECKNGRSVARRTRWFNIISKKCSANMYSFDGDGSSIGAFRDAYKTLAARTDYGALQFNLSAYDRFLLRLLYSPEVSVGESADDLMQTLPKLIKAESTGNPAPASGH